MAFDRGSPLIFRIPNEILADIFLLNTNTAFDYYDAFSSEWISDHDPRQTTRYSSQVCQRWRNVALEYPTLWSRIIRYEEDPLPWINELLRRSHPTTLALCGAHEFGLLENPPLHVLNCVMRHAQRLKTVSMSVERAAWQEICKGILQTRAPNLEYFHLVASIWGVLVFTGTLFSDDAPRLRRLHLGRCLVNLSSSALSNLTELSLQDIASGAPTVHAWLTILRNMPFLRWLTMIGAISTPLSIHPLPTSSLPNLSCLSIDGNFLECIAFVDHIDCPPLGVLRLKCTGATSGPTLKRLLSIIEKRLNFWRTPAKADRNFLFKCLQGNAIQMGNTFQIDRPWNVSESDDSNEALEDPVLSIRLFFGDFEEMESSVLPALLSFSHVLTTVSCLTFWLDSTTEYMFNRLLGAFHLFNNVEELDILDNSPVILLPLMQTPQPIGEDLPPMNYLPSLRKLLLYGINYHHDEALAFDVLVSYLQHRQQLLAPIETIRFSHGYLERAQRERLQQFTSIADPDTDPDIASIMKLEMEYIAGLVE